MMYTNLQYPMMPGTGLRVCVIGGGDGVVDLKPILVVCLAQAEQSFLIFC